MAESGSLTVNVGSYDSDYSLYTDPTGDVSGKNADNTSSYVTAIGSKGATNWIYWPFDVSQIPADAQINTVSCRFRAWVSFVTYINCSGSLCSGTTTKAGGVSIQDTTSKVYTVSGGMWTRDEIAKCRLKLTATFSSSSNATVGRRYFYLGGADLTVTYTYQNEKFMLKLGGKYNDVARVFKKVSGIWVEQTDLANVIEDGVRYQNGGEYVAPKKTVTIKGTGNSSNGYVTINGTKYTSAATVRVEGGTTVGITLDCDMYNLLCKVTLNGTVVHENSTTNAETYYHIVDSDCTITLASTGSGGGYKADIVTTGSGSSATLITFNIDGTSYQAEEGMTWGEWVASSYNTVGFFLDDDESVWDADYDYAVTNGSNLVRSSWAIESGYAYKLI